MSLVRNSSRLLQSTLKRVQSVPVALYHENVSLDTPEFANAARMVLS